MVLDLFCERVNQARDARIDTRSVTHYPVAKYFSESVTIGTWVLGTNALLRVWNTLFKGGIGYPPGGCDSPPLRLSE